MKRHNSNYIIGLISILCLYGALASCTHLEEVEGLGNKGELAFSVKVADNWDDEQGGKPATKSTYSSHKLDSTGLWLNTTVKELSDSSLTYSDAGQTRASEKSNFVEGNQMGIYAYLDDLNATDNEFMINQMVELTSSGWVYSPIKYWPLDHTINFYGYFPYGTGADGNGIVASESGAAPSITYTVPTDVSSQVDLLAASYSGKSAQGDVRLYFDHILTAIKFKTASGIQKGKVTRVSLKGVKNSGTYNLIDGEWNTSSSSIADYTQSVNVETTSGTANTPITDENQIFMMIPQTLPDDALIEIDFTFESGVKWTLSKKIKEITPKWTKGSAITYTISNSPLEWDYTLDINVNGESQNNISIGYGGAYKNFTVTSKRKPIGGTTDEADEAVTWTAQFSTDEGNTWKDYDELNEDDQWLTDFTLSGTDNTSFVAEILPQPIIDVQDQNTAILREKSLVGEKGNHVDLSGGGETANCYRVHAGGYYKLPLIYGNARNAGGALNSYAIANFKDYQNEPIKDKDISVPTGGDATLVWQDAPGVINDVKLDAAREFLEFYVDKDFIRPCNAIVAVRDADDNIMWSWHIWVTTYEKGVGDGIYTYNGKSYTFMPVNLGWCDVVSGLTYGSADRSIQVKIIQHQGLEKVITLTQTTHSNFTVSNGNSPYYQWGRKDPTPPASGNGDHTGDANGLKVGQDYYYNKETFGPYSFGITPEDESKSLGWSIQNPHIFIKNTDTGLWCNEDSPNSPSKGKRYDYWDSGQTQDVTFDGIPSIKTIYDPSPVGYKVPEADALDAVAQNFDGKNNLSLINVIKFQDGSDPQYEDYFTFDGSGTYSGTPTQNPPMYQRWYLLGQRTDQGLLREVTEADTKYNYSDDSSYGHSGGHQGYFYSANGQNFSNVIRGSFLHLSKNWTAHKISTSTADFRVYANPIRPVRDLTNP